MSEWKETKISNVCQRVTSGGTPRTNNPAYYNGTIPWLKTQEVNFNRIWETETKITERGLVESSAKIIQKNSVIVAMYGVTAGRVAINKIPLSTNQACCNLSPNEDVCDHNFLYYYLSNAYEDLRNLASGAAQQNLNVGLISNFPILLPTLYEQKAIAEILSSLDDKIDLLHRQNRTLEHLAETLFRQWFVEETEASSEIIRIKDIADINKHSITKFYPFTEIEYLETGSITNGKIESWQEYQIQEAPSRAQRLLKSWDIVYSLVRPNHRHFGILINPKKNSIASSGFCVISCRCISPLFVYYLLTRDETVEQLQIIAEGSTSTYPSLRPDDIANFEFSKPRDSQLIKFHEYAKSAWEKIDANFTEIMNLVKIKDILLPKLMTNQILVNK